jgi:hypothetical protein
LAPLARLSLVDLVAARGGSLLGDAISLSVCGVDAVAEAVTVVLARLQRVRFRWAAFPRTAVDIDVLMGANR